MKFSHIRRGTRAFTRVDLPLANSPGALLPDQPELAQQRAADGSSERQELTVGIRALTPGEFAVLLERAASYAKARGVDSPDDRNPIYSLGYNLNLVALACVDPDSDPRNPEPFFGLRGDLDGAVEEILRSNELTPDSLLYLVQHQERWQDTVSPQANKLSPEKLWELVGEVAVASDAGPFLRLRPGMQWQFTRFMACHLLSSQMPSSPSRSGSSESI